MSIEDKYKDNLAAMLGIDRILPLEVFFSPEEREEIERLAKEQGVSESEYVRNIVFPKNPEN